MTDLHRAALALGIAASLTASVSAFALDAVTPGEDGAIRTAAVTATSDAPAPSSETQQAVDLVSGGVAAKPLGDPSCPTVTLAPSGGARRADGARATLDGLARDCANLGAETICKIALVGESARKKKKGATAIEAPMTIQVKDAEGRDVETRRINLKVEMPEGVQKVAFRHVEEGVSLPPAAAGGYADWTIVVGFDPTAEPEAVAAAAEEEPAAEAARPAKAKRYAKSRSKYRTTRSRAVNRARSVASRRAAPRQPQQPPVVVTAKPQGQPAAAITTTTSGSAMAKAAQAFTERRDRALAEKRARETQGVRQTSPAPQAGRPPQPQASAAQRQSSIQTAQTN